MKPRKCSCGNIRTPVTVRPPDLIGRNVPAGTLMRCRKGTAAIMALKPETHPECSCGNIPSALGDCELASLVIRERAELPLGGKKMREMFPQEHTAGDRRIAGASIRRCTLCLHK